MQNGQIMMLTVVIMGATLLLASAIAGYVVVSQLKNTQDIAKSVQAFFAADAGVEEALHCYFKTEAGVNLNIQLIEIESGEEKELDFKKIEGSEITKDFCTKLASFENKTSNKSQITFAGATSTTGFGMIKVRGFRAYAIGTYEDDLGRALESQYFVRN